MTEEIKQAINKFKDKNGNNNFTNKDLLMYLVQRVDNLPCVAHLKSIENSSTTIKNFKWFAGILITVIFGLIGTLFAIGLC